jgi:transcriptional regulator with XRE-family HTH domain
MPKEKVQSSNPEKESKSHNIPDIDRDYIKKIAAKAKFLREEKGYSYESFALQAQINRNSYFRFEKSAVTGDNYTVALLLRVIRGLSMTATEFFKDIQ